MISFDAVATYGLLALIFGGTFAYFAWEFLHRLRALRVAFRTLRDRSRRW